MVCYQGREKVTYCTDNNMFLPNIESTIRPLVKLLRDNGFNTQASCGHDMWVSMDWEQSLHPIDAPITVLKNLLYQNGYSMFHIYCETITGKHTQRWFEKASIVVVLPIYCSIKSKMGIYSHQASKQFHWHINQTYIIKCRHCGKIDGIIIHD